MVFDSAGSYILDKSSGEKASMKWHRHTPVFEVEVMQPLDRDRKCIENMEVTQKSSDGPPDTPGASSSTDGKGAGKVTDSKPFHRQAQSKL